jgi:hypothetical protein
VRSPPGVQKARIEKKATARTGRDGLLRRPESKLQKLPFNHPRLIRGKGRRIKPEKIRIKRGRPGADGRGSRLESRFAGLGRVHHR